MGTAGLPRQPGGGRGGVWSPAPLAGGHAGPRRGPAGSCQGGGVLCVIMDLHSDCLTVREAFGQKSPFRANNNSGFLL